MPDGFCSFFESDLSNMDPVEWDVTRFRSDSCHTSARELSDMYEKARIVVTVMAYPAISLRHGEAVCLAGIKTDTIMSGEWVRLFPLDARHLPSGLRIRKWDEIDLRMVKTADDHRPESFTPDYDSLRVVGRVSTSHAWRGRKTLVDLLPQCETMREVEENRAAASLAVVHPGEIVDFEITRKPSAEIAKLQAKAAQLSAQTSLFDLGGSEPLEPIPLDFHYIVRYPDEPEPRRLKLIDWEVNQTWRKWRNLYPDVEDRLRDRWLNDLVGPGREVRFFVGNQKRFPEQFLLLNVFSAPIA